jgi:hypothetical protein
MRFFTACSIVLEAHLQIQMIPHYKVSDPIKKFFDIERINNYLNDLLNLKPFISYCEKI